MARVSGTPSDGVSIVQTADGALEESVSIVNTIKTKAIQAASDTQTSTTRSAIQQDIDKLLEELDSIATTTSYNGMQLLNGSYTNKVIQTGASANETSSISIGDTEDSIGHISTATLELGDEDGGEIAMSITSSITGEEIELETVTIEANNEEKNGLGALADEINSVSSTTGISAMAVVESTSALAIQEGTTGTDFSINGVTIGAINVETNDSDASLVTAINDKTTQTGISAAINDDGTITMTSDDGRVISVTGELNGVFGEDVTAGDLSTIGHISLTQEGSSQFNISGTSSAGTEASVTLSADYETTDDSTVSAGSKIKAGSELSVGTILGGDAEVYSTVADTLSEYELVSGSNLAAGTVLSQGTVTGGSIVVAGNTATGSETTYDLNQDMSVAKGSSLAVGSTLGAGTLVTTEFEAAGTTYEAGYTLTSDVELDDVLNLTAEMTLSEDSALAAGSNLTAGTEMGADITIGYSYDSGIAITDDPQSDALTMDAYLHTDTAAADIGDDAVIAAGSTLADGSVITLATSGTYSGPTLYTTTGVIQEGDTLADDTQVTLSGDQTFTENLTLGDDDAVNDVIKAGSILAEGSDLTNSSQLVAGDFYVATLDNATLTEDMTLEAGSTLVAGSDLVSGSTLGDETLISGEAGADLTTYAETKVTSGSTLLSGSIMEKGSGLDGSITVADITVGEGESLTLEAGSTLVANTKFAAGTTINQDMTLNTATAGGGDDIEITAGTVITEDLYANGTINLTENMTLVENSEIKSGSELSISSEGAGGLTLSEEESLTLSDINVLTQEDAEIAITIAEAALADLDSTRSSLGSVENQLTSTISNLSVTKTNVMASESTIRDVDFAEETSNYAKLSLLAQTSSYALSQANASSSNITSLLQ